MMHVKEQEAPQETIQQGIGWMTTKQAATYIQVNQRTILKMVHDQVLEASYIGQGRKKSLRFQRSALDLYMYQHRAT